MARVLVTGGAGFIGSHLCAKILASGHELICLDNFFTGRRENILEISKNDRCEVLRHDVIEPILLEVDQIYHLACPASPVHYQYNPVKTIKTSVIGTINMLGLAKRVGARILLASTSEVYGDPLVHPQKESYWGNVNPIGPRSCYDEGKRVAETLMMDYHHQNGVDIRIVRIFNTYGPRMMLDDGRVVSNFIVQALRDEPISLYGDGMQTRSFCYVDDLVNGLMRMMETVGFVGPVNLGNPCEMSVTDLALKIVKFTNSRSEFTYLPLPKDDPVRRQPDISLAREKLGWEPEVNVDEGLERTIVDFRPRVNAS
ncbi:MAG: SDR family oxidoreductase [Deltaproteobacteria bacterium]|nr:SDR family oxidoreductase [Deltaproteobacteria bacterium]